MNDKFRKLRSIPKMIESGNEVVMIGNDYAKGFHTILENWYLKDGFLPEKDYLK